MPFLPVHTRLRLPASGTPAPRTGLIGLSLSLLVAASILGACSIPGLDRIIPARGPTAPATATAPLSASEKALNGPRVALVIGNGDYAEKPLTNAVNDAVAMRDLLADHLGFEVIFDTNADQDRMKQMLKDFSKRLSPSTVGLFYYAGHGLQLDNNNYLVPIGAKVESKTDIRNRTFDARDVLEVMEDAHNALNVVILDACRTQPFRSFRGPDDGLASLTGPTGTLIAYATSPGKVAVDQGKAGDRNGVYTKNLLKWMQQPGLTIEEMFKRVRTDVKAETDPDQVPWENSSIEGQFCFSGCQPPSPPVAAAVPVAGIATAAATTAEKSPVLPAPNPPAPETPTPRCRECPETVALPGGSFQMGSNEGDSDEKPVHEVTVRPFRMGRTEVTQAQWRAVMDSDPSHFKGCDDCPVEEVSFEDIQTYLAKLNRLSPRPYRLPTEAEWEYACRGGKQETYCGSNEVNGVALYWDNAYRKTHEVAGKAPNGFGLYDLPGNVLEWTCSDYTERYDGSEQRCGNGSRRVLRGGSWDGTPANVRAAVRDWRDTTYRYVYLGFRLAQD